MFDINSKFNAFVLSLALLLGVLIGYPNVARADKDLASYQAYIAPPIAQIAQTSTVDEAVVEAPKVEEAAKVEVIKVDETVKTPKVEEAAKTEASIDETTEATKAEEAAKAEAEKLKDAAKAEAKKAKKAAKAEAKKAKEAAKAEAKKLKEAAKAEAKKAKEEEKAKKDKVAVPAAFKLPTHELVALFR